MSPYLLLLCLKKRSEHVYIYRTFFLRAYFWWRYAVLYNITKRILTYAHIHSYKHKYIYICHYLSIGEFGYLLWFWKAGCYMWFVAPPVTEDYMSSLSPPLLFRHIVQHRQLVHGATDGLNVWETYRNVVACKQISCFFFNSSFSEWGCEMMHVLRWW